LKSCVVWYVVQSKKIHTQNKSTKSEIQNKLKQENLRKQTISNKKVWGNKP